MGYERHMQWDVNHEDARTRLIDLMEDGLLIFFGTRDEVLNKPSLEYAKDLYSYRSGFWRLGLSGVFLVVNSRWKARLGIVQTRGNDRKDDDSEIYNSFKVRMRLSR